MLKRDYHVNTIGDHSPEDGFQICLGGIFLAYPTHYEKYGVIPNMGNKIAITMFESEKLPDGWVRELNHCKAVIVPSHWCKQVFINEGVTTPVHVIPLGISESYNYQPRQLDVPDDYVYNFVAIGLANQRKGWGELCEAFYLAFEDNPQYRLTFKNREGDIPTLKKLSSPNVFLIREDYDEDEMNRFYGGFDYMIFPSHGEGFGLPPREFAVTGGIAVATNYSGLADDIEMWGVPVPVHGTEVAWTASTNKDLTNVGTWAKIEPEDIAQILLHVVKYRRDYLINARQTSEDTRALYNWDRFAEGVLEVWKDVHGFRNTDRAL